MKSGTLLFITFLCFLYFLYSKYIDPQEPKKQDTVEQIKFDDIEIIQEIKINSFLTGEYYVSTEIYTKKEGHYHTLEEWLTEFCPASDTTKVKASHMKIATDIKNKLNDLK